MISKTWVWSFA